MGVGKVGVIGEGELTKEGVIGLLGGAAASFGASAAKAGTPEEIKKPASVRFLAIELNLILKTSQCSYSGVGEKFA